MKDEISDTREKMTPSAPISMLAISKKPHNINDKKEVFHPIQLAKQERTIDIIENLNPDGSSLSSFQQSNHYNKVRKEASKLNKQASKRF